MNFDDELEEFRQWKLLKNKKSSLDIAFENLERIMENPFYRGYDSAFRLICKCLFELKKTIELKEPAS